MAELRNQLSPIGSNKVSVVEDGDVTAPSPLNLSHPSLVTISKTTTYSTIFQIIRARFSFTFFFNSRNVVCMAVSSYISINPQIRFGKPCIKGTRISVSDILQWLASGMSQEEILEDYPQLKKEHILAALAFAADRETMIKIVAVA